MNYDDALKIANRYISILAPHCERIEIAGSIRRKKKEVGDIELVCIPKHETIADGMFETKEIPSTEFCNIVNSIKHIKGFPDKKYCQRMTPEGIKLDLFITTAADWGYIFAIRTGSARYSHHVIVHAAKKNGFTLKDGKVYGVHGHVPMPDEREFFKRIKLDWVDPEFRAA